jgi:hypothetical protein
LLPHHEFVAGRINNFAPRARAVIRYGRSALDRRWDAVRSIGLKADLDKEREKS